MSKKHLVAALLVAPAFATAAVAYGATTHTVSSKAGPNKAGSTAAPAAFNASFTYAGAGADGDRAATPLKWAWKWDGVANNGGSFPKCTAGQIDAQQSDSVCPKGALIGTAQFTAKLGPESDKKQAVGCEGKQVKMYNGGAKSIVWFIVGPGEKCAGIQYLPPFTLKLKTSGGSTTTTLAFPDNITHPLPGIEGGIVTINPKFKKLSRKVKGKTVHYMASTRCKGSRTFTFTVTDSEGTTKKTANAGRCS